MNREKSHAALIAELEALRIKNKRLEHRVSDLEEKLDKKNRISDVLAKASRDVSIERYGSYLKYKYNLIKSTDVWNTAERVFAYSRRSLFVAKLFKYASVIVAFIETSAVFLICATVFAVVIPLTLVLALIFYIVDTVTAKKYNNLIIPKLEDKKVIFMIAQKGYKKSRGTYFDRMVRDLAADGRYYVVVVTKSVRDGLFLTARFEEEDLTVIRESYFFRLKRAIKDAGIADDRIMIVH